MLPHARLDSHIKGIKSFRTADIYKLLCFLLVESSKWSKFREDLKTPSKKYRINKMDELPFTYLEKKYTTIYNLVFFEATKESSML